MRTSLDHPVNTILVLVTMAMPWPYSLLLIANASSKAVFIGEQWWIVFSSLVSFLQVEAFQRINGDINNKVCYQLVRTKDRLPITVPSTRWHAELVVDIHLCDYLSPKLISWPKVLNLYTGLWSTNQNLKPTGILIFYLAVLFFTLELNFHCGFSVETLPIRY